MSVPTFTREEVIALEIMASLVRVNPSYNAYDLARSAFTAADAFMFVHNERQREQAEKRAAMVNGNG